MIAPWINRTNNTDSNPVRIENSITLSGPEANIKFSMIYKIRGSVTVVLLLAAYHPCFTMFVSGCNLISLEIPCSQVIKFFL